MENLLKVNDGEGRRYIIPTRNWLLIKALSA